MPTILHVDLNSYFATIEQQQNPQLRGKPVGIVKDLGRSCIIAASKEAKLLGIKTGSNYYQVKSFCPQLTLIKADFAKYLSYTRRFYSLIRSFTPSCTLFSLDEAFLDASDCLKLYGSSDNLALKIQEKIYLEIGEWVTASIGISHNRLLAKLAGEYAPKGGFYKIEKENLDLALAMADFTQICGIGYRLAKKLKTLSIKNLLEIRDLDEDLLKKNFGLFWASELKNISLGDNSHLLTLLDTNSQMKGVGRTITGFKLCADEKQIKQIIRNLIEEASFKVREMKMAGRHLSIFLQGENRIWCHRKTLKHYVRHPDEIYDILYNRFYKNFKNRFPVIRFGIHIGLLKPLNRLTDCLLPSWKKREKIYQATDKINKKHGYLVLKPATLLKHKIIKPEVTGYLGDKLYRFRET